MAECVKGRVYIITGSAGGLGRAFAEQLLLRGAKVCISDIKEETGRRTLLELQREHGEERVAFVHCDVTSIDSIRNLWAETEQFFKQEVYCLVNNAGVAGNEAWQLTMDINLKGVLNGTTLAMDKLGRSGGGGGGIIVNVASILGLFNAQQPKGFQYNVSKSGVVTLTRCMGNKASFEKDGVRVLCLCPSVASTPILENCTAEELAKMRADVGAFMTPEYVAKAFILLLEGGRSGDVMAVWSTAPPYYIPDVSFALFVLFTTCAMILNWVPGVRTVRPWMMVLVMVVLLVIWYLGATFSLSLVRSLL